MDNMHSRSSENITAVQQLYAAFANQNIEAILAALSPTVAWGEPANPLNPAAGTRHGHAGFLEWLRIGHASEEVLVLEPRQFLADADSVAVVGYTQCLARSTGKRYETDFVHLIFFKDGKIERFREFFDTYAAAEAFRPE
jgi:uncharacterized protein